MLVVSGEGLAETWERSVLALWQEGCRIRTEYDRRDKDGNFIDPPSVDSTMMFTVKNPAAEPRFHRCFPGGPADLQEYRMEVLEGIKDHWVDLNDKSKWQYTYHERLTKYQDPRLVKWNNPIEGPHAGPLPPLDQIQKMIEHLAKSPYTRRCQAITWQPWEDMDSSDPPCLQRIWCRILVGDDGEWWLNMNVSFRSRDAYKAAFMNADAFICLMKYIAFEVSRIAERPVHLGHYCDMSDSYHIYGKDIAQFTREFLDQTHARSFEERTYTSNFLLPMLREVIPAIEDKVRQKDAAR